MTLTRNEHVPKTLPFVLSNETYGNQYCLPVTQNFYVPEVDAKPT